MADLRDEGKAGGSSTPAGRSTPQRDPQDAADLAPETSTSRRGALLKLAGLAVLVIAGLALARFTPVGDYLSRQGIGRGIELVRGSPWAPALFVLTYGVAMALALPGTVLTLAGGALFGFWWGVVFNTLGANLGANAAFGVSRWLGRDGVERLAGDRLEKLDKATRNYGFRGLLTLRLIPVVPFNALNFGAGLTAMSWATYAVATLVGIFPGTVVYTLFADALLQGSQEASREAFLRMILAGALLVLLSFLPTIMKKLNMKITGGAGAVLLLLSGLVAGVPPDAPASSADRLPIQALPDHQAFTRVLQPHVEGSRVDYAALQEDRAALDGYLDRLRSTAPGVLADASRSDRLAFWINAYNACMLKLVVDHYPLTGRPGLLQRLRNLFAGRPENSVWRIDDVFTRQHCEVAGEPRSQDEIEHEIIRPTFQEPRIHFAVNCAAMSCPRLAAEAYTGDALDAQLDRQVRAFMNDPDHFRLTDGTPPVLTVNRVLDWYGDDFGGADGVRRFFSSYAEGPTRALLADPDTRVEYFDYDWTLNDVRR